MAHRDVDLGVLSLPLPEDLRIDGQPAAELLRFEVLATQEDVLNLSTGTHPLASRRSLGLQALAGEPMVMLDRSTASRALFDARMAALSVRAAQS